MQETSPKPFVFVLMPFNKGFDDVYNKAIIPACADAGAYAERVDKQIYRPGTILERIYNQINKADVIVADMSDRNPNVCYEVGYAHALNKVVILLANKSEDIPFDLMQYKHIIYDKREITSLKNELQKHVIFFLENPKPAKGNQVDPLIFYVNDKVVSDSEHEIELKPDGASWHGEFKFGINNSTEKVMETRTISIAFVTEREIRYKLSPMNKVHDKPDGKFLSLFMEKEEISPGIWKSKIIPFMIESSSFPKADDFILRVASHDNVKDHRFRLIYKQKPRIDQMIKSSDIQDSRF